MIATIIQIVIFTRPHRPIWSTCQLVASKKVIATSRFFTCPHCACMESILCRINDKQCPAKHCTAWCKALQSIAEHCKALQSIEKHCKALHYLAVPLQISRLPCHCHHHSHHQSDEKMSCFKSLSQSLMRSLTKPSSSLSSS